MSDERGIEGLEPMDERQALEYMTYEQRVEHYFRFPPDTHSPYAQRAWESKYDGRGDLTPDGRNIADWNRRVVGPQMQGIVNQREPKERK